MYKLGFLHSSKYIRKYTLESALMDIQWSLRYETAPSAGNKRSLVGVRSDIGVRRSLKWTSWAKISILQLLSDFYMPLIYSIYVNKLTLAIILYVSFKLPLSIYRKKKRFFTEIVFHLDRLQISIWTWYFRPLKDCSLAIWTDKRK